MNSIVPNLNYTCNIPLYVQLYEYIKDEILSGRITPNEKLPSIRELSKILNLSKTTVESSYDQLLVEGYIFSKPQSGYYTNNISLELLRKDSDFIHSHNTELLNKDEEIKSKYIDMSSFDFIKWKKCTNKILTEYNHALLTEGFPQGEEALREEISKYVYQSRGVLCTPDQIVIGAGTQQIMNLLCVMLENMGVKGAAFEDPGYYPARKIFSDRGFRISPVSIEEDGINLKELRESACSLVYVSPSHQFPLGSVMPIAKRHELLEWAYENNRLIIEDDYDSELRYFGRPVPSLQGLDKEERVIYLGSFSTTLLPSMKISYIILPNSMLLKYKNVMHNYNQTCSKIEQLTLALYMKEGLYQKQIKKLRKLYSNKVQLLKDKIQKEMHGAVKVLSHTSGMHMLLEIDSPKSAEALCNDAREIGIHAVPIDQYMIRKNKKEKPVILLYYTQIPLSDIPKSVLDLKKIWGEKR